MSFRVSPGAMGDVEMITAGIQLDSPSAAGRWLDGLYRRFVTLGEMLGMGTARPELGKGVRLFPVGQYVVLYEEGAVEGVDIVRVIHGKRDPDTWLS